MCDFSLPRLIPRIYWTWSLIPEPSPTLRWPWQPGGCQQSETSIRILLKPWSATLVRRPQPSDAPVFHVGLSPENRIPLNPSCFIITLSLSLLKPCHIVTANPLIIFIQTHCWLYHMFYPTIPQSYPQLLSVLSLCRLVSYVSSVSINWLIWYHSKPMQPSPTLSRYNLW